MSKLTLLPALLFLALHGLQAQPKEKAVPASASRPLELKWGELAPVIAGQRVQIALPDGAVIKGDAVAVRDDALVVNVKKTSNSAAYPKGNAAIPRASLTLIRVESRRGSRGRAIGTTVGVISGVALGLFAAAETAYSDAAILATLVGVASAGTVGGYFAGKALDKQHTYIKVVP